MSMPPASAMARLVAQTLLVRIGGADQEVDPLRVEIRVTEEVFLHEPAVRAGILGPQADELVEVEGRRLRPVEGSSRGQADQLLVQRDRRTARGQPEDEIGILLECRGQTRRDDPGCGPGIREHGHSWTADR